MMSFTTSLTNPLTMLLALAVSLAAPVTYADSTSMQTLFIEAENTANKEDAIALWKQMLTRFSDQDFTANPAISRQQLHYNIVNDYVSVYARQHDREQLEAVQDYIRELDNASERAWSHIHVLHEMAKHSQLSKDKKTYELAQEFLDDVIIDSKSLGDANAKGDLSYALADIITRPRDKKIVFESEELSLVHGLVASITDSRQRIQIMKAYANVPSSKARFPKQLKSLYTLLAKDKISSSEQVRLYEKALGKNQFDLALYSILSIDDIKQRPKKLREFFRKMMEKKEFSRALRIAEKTDNIAAAVNLWSALGIHYMEYDYVERAEEAYGRASAFADMIESPESKAKAINLISERYAKGQRNKGEKVKIKDESLLELQKQAIELAENDNISDAVKLVKGVDNFFFRVKTFRRIAEIQTRKNDLYKLLPAEDGTSPSVDFYTLGGKPTRNAPTQETVDNFEAKITSQMTYDPDEALLHNAPLSPVGDRIAFNPLVKHIAMNGEIFRTMIPPVKGADIHLSYYENNLYNAKFYGVYGNAGFTQSQKTAAPLAITIENGSTDLTAIYDYLKLNNGSQCMHKKGSTYTLRCPIIVNHGATFILTGDDVDALRLSSQAGAYLVNIGKTYISDTIVTGWDEKKDKPMFATYEDKRKFRPYITTWSRSELNIANSMIQTLGYGNGKSYGLAYSAGPKDWYKLGNLGSKERPTGIVVDNSFHNTLYGFYSYEADDVILVGNEYIDNVVYGIDPHDRSERLTIAYNTAYGTYKKHGIIISREVNNSIIMGNVSFANKGTGIMLDRDSNQTLVYGNTTFENEAEGMTVFESDCEIIAANKMFNNKGAGFRIRNSYNIGLFHNDVRGNRLGVAAYTGVLKGDPVHAHRDFDLDPYDTLTTVTAVGNHIEANKQGIMVENVDALYMKQNKFINQSPKIYNGDWFKRYSADYFKTDRRKAGVSMNNACPDLDEPIKIQSCQFRNDGTLYADGQDQLVARLQKSSCTKGTGDVLDYTDGGTY